MIKGIHTVECILLPFLSGMHGPMVWVLPSTPQSVSSTTQTPLYHVPSVPLCPICRTPGLCWSMCTLRWYSCCSSGGALWSPPHWRVLIVSSLGVSQIHKHNVLYQFYNNRKFYGRLHTIKYFSTAFIIIIINILLTFIK